MHVVCVVPTMLLLLTTIKGYTESNVKLLPDVTGPYKASTVQCVYNSSRMKVAIKFGYYLS